MSEQGGETVTLDPRIQELSQSLVVKDGVVTFPPKGVDAWVSRLRREPAGSRQHHSRQILALALKLRDHLGEAAIPAIEQLATLVVELTAQASDAETLRTSSGLSAEEARATGRVLAKRPVGGDAPRGSKKALELILRR